jgi:uncharacterized protein (DUF1499 family)
MISSTCTSTRKTGIRAASPFLAAAVAVLALTGCAGVGQTRAGLDQGSFLPCPDSPNCVSSLAGPGQAAILPFYYTGSSREEALNRLVCILDSEPRCRIISVEELDNGSMYVHAEFRSALFRFVDDVEFLLPAGEALIHVKSASRLGYSDMGVNRERVERLRVMFESSAGM